MIERYTRPELGAIWTEVNKYRAWLEVEILACEAWAELAEIPWEDVRRIREKASFSGWLPAMDLGRKPAGLMILSRRARWNPASSMSSGISTMPAPTRIFRT